MNKYIKRKSSLLDGNHIVNMWSVHGGTIGMDYIGAQTQPKAVGECGKESMMDS